MKVIYGEGICSLWNDKELYTSKGVVKDAKIGKVRTGLGETLYCFEARFGDVLKNIKRGPQIPLQKDVLNILDYVDKDSFVVEAGTGSGVVACNLARFVKKVVSYEIKKEHFEIAQKNISLFGFDNIEMKNKDIKEISENDVDMIFLDLQNPELVISEVYDALKFGGYLVVYLPNIPQIQELIKILDGRFLQEKIFEVLEREWMIDEVRARPKTQMIGHSGFLSVFRKI